jgi:hypothetical protein
VTIRPFRVPALILVAAIGLTAGLAGCGATTTPSPSPSASPSPVPSTAASATPEPSLDLHGAPDLEARLVDEVGGVEMTSVSLTGPDVLASGGAEGREQLLGLLDALGRTVDDLTVAQAHDPAGALVFQQGLFRVAGADPTELLTLWVAAQQAATQNRVRVSNTTVDGVDLTLVEDPTRPVGGRTYAFADGDILVLILADDEALLSEALAAWA